MTHMKTPILPFETMCHCADHSDNKCEVSTSNVDARTFTNRDISMEWALQNASRRHTAKRRTCQIIECLVSSQVDVPRKFRLQAWTSGRANLFLVSSNSTGSQSSGTSSFEVSCFSIVTWGFPSITVASASYFCRIYHILGRQILHVWTPSSLPTCKTIHYRTESLLPPDCSYTIQYFFHTSLSIDRRSLKHISYRHRVLFAIFGLFHLPALCAES